MSIRIKLIIPIVRKIESLIIYRNALVHGKVKVLKNENNQFVYLLSNFIDKGNTNRKETTMVDLETITTTIQSLHEQMKLLKGQSASIITI